MTLLLWIACGLSGVHAQRDYSKLAYSRDNSPMQLAPKYGKEGVCNSYIRVLPYCETLRLKREQTRAIVNASCLNVNDSKNA